jgi:hypothetical protein
MTTVAELKADIINLLGEEQAEGVTPIAGTTTPAAVLLKGIHAGLLALSSRYWKSAVLEVPADSEATEINSPADLIAVEAFYDTKLAVFIPQKLFQVGEGITGSQIQNSWYPYPAGKISVTKALADGGQLYYSAHWTLPDSDDDTIEAPVLCSTFITLYAVSYCLLRKANEQGEIKQFATKVDSGNPLTLPAKELSDFYMKRALAELQFIPMKQKGIS